MKSIKLHADSLRIYNKNLNMKLRTLISTMDKQTERVIGVRSGSSGFHTTVHSL